MGIFVRKNKKERQQGFTLVETMVSIAIFAVISLALLSLFFSIFQSVRRNKAILAANAIMSEQMEIIRGMNYDDVTTVAGFVDGKLPNSEEVTKSGITFTITRDITMVDDPYDGTASSTPPDTFQWDYKQVRISLAWKDPVTGSEQKSTAVTNVVPEGLEGLAEGKGGIYITVFDADGEGVPQAVVNMKSVKTGYEISGQLTDNNGNLWVPDLDPADDYRVVATKNGYSMERTYAVNDDEDAVACDLSLIDCNPYNPEPVKRDLRVAEQEVTRAGFAIDRLGSLDIKTVRLSNMVNWRVNKTKSGLLYYGQQWDPSGTMAPSADPLHPYLFAVFTDDRDSIFYPQQCIYLQKLAYNSASGKYEPVLSYDKKITALICANAQNAIIKTSPKDNTIWVVWDDKSSGNQDVYLQNIDTSSGAPSGTRYKVNQGALSATQTNPDMEIDHEGNIYVVWEDNRNGNWDIYMQKFDTVNKKFLSNDKKVNPDEASANEQLNPKIAVDNDMEGGANSNNTYVVWQSNHSGDFDIYIQKFNKNVVKNGGAKKVNDASLLDQYEPDVVYDGSSYLYAAWTDERNSEPDIYFQKLDKNCDRVLTTTGDVLINDDTYASATRTKPSIAYSGPDAIYVTWEDNRNGLPYYTIYTSRVNSIGERQWMFDFMASDTYKSVQTDPFTLVDPEGYAITLWGDNREEEGDLGGFFAFPDDPLLTDEIFGSRYKIMENTALSNIPVKITSENYIGTSLTGEKISKYEEVFYSAGSGQISTGNVIEWGDYMFSILSGSGYDLESTHPPMPLTVFPGQESSITIDVKP